jgi:hypothetical protein
MPFLIYFADLFLYRSFYVKGVLLLAGSFCLQIGFDPFAIVILVDLVPFIFLQSACNLLTMPGH